MRVKKAGKKSGNKTLKLQVISRENPRGELYDEKRQLPRLCLSSEQFRLTQTGKLFSVANLSAGGMSVWLMDRSDLSFFVIGQMHSGVLNLNREKVAVQTIVQNFTSDRVGFKFENLSEDSAKKIAQFLDPSFLCAEWKLLPSHKNDTLWFHGRSGTDLLLQDLVDGQYQKLSLYILGSLIQWDHKKGYSTGRVCASSEQSDLRGILRMENLFLILDPQPDPGKLDIAKKVILSSNLSQDLKNWCARQFERA